MAKFLLALAFAWLAWRFWYHGPNPRRRYQSTPPRPAGSDQTTLAEARGVLGVSAGADEAEIRAAHRRLIATAHPDHGGSDEQTQRINAARDALLAQAKSSSL
ncbi:J domain-containing protein [Sphingomonas sp. GlSt437]|uniref:J domain-containing protein n=1 Tax=Sphingomonas sp. GlSt437 TaxID=3389970 RepID=UPI003A87B127